MVRLRSFISALLVLSLISVGSDAFAAGANDARATSTVAQLRQGWSSKVPPVPTCFSQPGPCNGWYLKPGGAPITVKPPSKNGVYSFGWNPLQFTTPVSCGDLGCLYNHMNWGASAGTVISGCQPNDSSCTIQVIAGQGWCPVTVTQNSYIVAFFLIYSPVTESPTSSTTTTLKSSLQVSVAAPNLKLGFGQSETVSVTVAASGASVNSISLGKGLTASTAAATILSGPTGTSTFSLGAGTSRSFEFKIKGTKEGSVLLSAVATGTSGSGSVQGSGSLALQVGGQVLSITAVSAPNPIALKMGKDGLVTPGSLTVTVTVKNTSPSPVDGVQLLSLNPVPVDPTQQLDKVAFDSGTFPLTYPGAFAPGSHATRTFKLKVTGDGEYQFQALALYNDPTAPHGNGRVSTIAGTFKVVVPLLTFTSTLHRDGLTERNGANWVRGGQKWYVGGSIKNLSSTKSICVSPLEAQASGNAASVGLQDVSKYNVNAAEPPFAGLLRPRQSVPLGMDVVTAPLGAAAGAIDVTVEGFVAAPGATCQLSVNGPMSGAGAALAPQQLDVAPDSTHFNVHVDLTPLPSSTVGAGGLEFFGSFAKNSFEFYSSIAVGLATLAKSMTTASHYRKVLLGMGIYDPVQVGEIVGRANAEIMATGRLLTNFMNTATPLQKQAVYNYVAQAISRVPNAAYSKLADETKVLGQQWFGQLLAAEESGNADQIWTAWSGLAGEGAAALNAVWLQLFMEGAGAQLAVRSSELEATAKLETAQPKVLTTSKGGVVPLGRLLSPADLATAWGLPEEIVTKIDRISQEMGVLIGARSRQAISTALEAQGAVIKNSNFHQKTVSALDHLYMGMSSIPEGALGFRSFTPAGERAVRQEILAAGLSADRQAEALARLNGRFAEMGEDFTHTEQLANTERTIRGVKEKGWVKAGFNATESGSIAAPTSVTRWRRFQLVVTPIYAKDGTTLLGTLYEPWEENIALASNPKFGRALPSQCRAALGTVLCRITGDIDLVYVTDLYGNSLAPAKMQKVMKALEQAGFAHTDLVTWVDQQSGSFYFPGKEGQLKGLAVGKEATVQFAPDGKQRATYLAPLYQSVSTGPNSYQLTIIGGYNPAAL